MAGLTVAALTAVVALVKGDLDEIWRSFGCTAVLAIAGTHTCLVLAARRPSDSDLVSALVFTSLGLAALDLLGGILPSRG